MSTHPNSLYLGIECGGTHSRALLASANGAVVGRWDGPGANFHLRSEKDFLTLLHSIRNHLPGAHAVGLAIAGARTAEDRQRASSWIDQVWGNQLPRRVDHDLEAAFLAAAPASPQTSSLQPAARIILLSGTGSCCYGANASLQRAKTGGWGHLLGDHGSGYDIGLRGLRRLVEDWDRTRRWPNWAAKILTAQLLNQPEDLIRWTLDASKSDIAALAPFVIDAALHPTESDPAAHEVIDAAWTTLALDAAACAKELNCLPQTSNIDWVFAGGIFLSNPAAPRRMAQILKRVLAARKLNCRTLDRDSVWGAVELAVLAHRDSDRAPSHPLTEASKRTQKSPARNQPSRQSLVPTARGLSPTEKRNPKSQKLDQLNLRDALELFAQEESRVGQVLRGAAPSLARVIQAVTRAWRAGGRLLYVGAGTSGRLGVLDASECPPTFGTPPEQVQGIIAGGARALWSAAEGAEDDPDAGAHAIRNRKVHARDVVIGIAASGRTPFVWGALVEARRRGAWTALISCRPGLKFSRDHKPKAVITLDTGPEILTGSTRLKAGTATKVALNAITTLAMVRSGKVLSNLMVDVRATNAKLRDRAIRMLAELTGMPSSNAEAELERSNWSVSKAYHRLHPSHANRRVALKRASPPNRPRT